MPCANGVRTAPRNRQGHRCAQTREARDGERRERRRRRGEESRGVRRLEGRGAGQGRRAAVVEARGRDDEARRERRDGRRGGRGGAHLG